MSLCTIQRPDTKGVQADFHTYLKIWERLQSGRLREWIRRMWSLPSSKTHQKDIYMWSNCHWKLAEDLLHSQSCKKDPHITGRITKRHWNRTSAPGRELWKKKSPYRWPLPLGTPFTGWEVHLARQRIWRGLDSAHEESACAGWLAVGTERDWLWWLPPQCTFQPYMSFRWSC